MSFAEIGVACSFALALVAVTRRTSRRVPKAPAKIAPRQRRRRSLRVVAAPVALPQLPAAEQPSAPGALAPFEELAAHYLRRSIVPGGGHFYTIAEDDTPVSVARDVLRHLHPTDAEIVDYVHCYSSVPFNLDRYGSPSTSRKYSAALLVPGLGQGLRAAFLPRNADGEQALTAAHLPPRTVDATTGAPVGEGTCRGTIWLPAVRRVDGTIRCTDAWSDGSSCLFPPPHMIALCRAA